MIDRLRAQEGRREPDGDAAAISMPEISTPGDVISSVNVTAIPAATS